MKHLPKLLLVGGVLLGSSCISEASANTTTKPEYTVKKDSVAMAPVDTNKRTVIFPNPFTVFTPIEEKKTGH